MCKNADPLVVSSVSDLHRHQTIAGNNETSLVQNEVALKDTDATDVVAETAASPLIAAEQPIAGILDMLICVRPVHLLV